MEREMSPEEKLEMGRKLTARTLEEPTLMPLTLEEIEKRLATADRIKTDGISWRSVDLLLAIAQEQRAEIARLQDNASTAAFDKIADQLGEANRENEEQRAELARRPRVGSCVWTMPDLTDRSFWSSTCGHEWQFLDGSPSENDSKFCPFCGGEIEEDVGEQR